MASLSDIPERLLEAGKKVEFVLWLKETGTTVDVRRNLIFLWRRYTSGVFTQSDYVAAMSTAPVRRSVSGG